MKLLRCICHRCGKLLIDKDDPEVQMISNKPIRSRFQDIYALSAKVKACGSDNPDGCGAPSPTKIIKEGVATIIAE